MVINNAWPWPISISAGQYKTVWPHFWWRIWRIIFYIIFSWFRATYSEWDEIVKLDVWRSSYMGSIGIIYFPELCFSCFISNYKSYTSSEMYRWTDREEKLWKFEYLRYKYIVFLWIYKIECIIIKLISVVFGIRLIVHVPEHFIKVLTRKTHVVQNTIAFARALPTVTIVIINFNWRTIMVIVQAFRNNFISFACINLVLK